MKKMKKVLALLVSLAMVLAMSVTAFAADATVGDITINGAIKDATYAAYKVFDVTYNGDAVSYTTPAGSAILSVEDFDTVFTTTGIGTLRYVTKKDGVTDEEVITWFQNHKEAVITACGDPVKEVTNRDGDGSVTLSTGAAGYYFINSTLGDSAAVTIDTAHPNMTVNSKIDSTPTVPTDGKKINGKQVNTMQVGEEATFTLTFNATNYYVNKGTSTPITQYVVTDTPDGFDIDKSTVEVTVNGAEYAIGEVTTSVNENGVLTVTIPWNQTTYAESNTNTVVVTYKATLKNTHLAAESKNTFSVKANDETIPNTPETYTYNYTIDITKVAAENNETKLSGAEFVLKNSEGKFYAVDVNGVVSWVDGQANAAKATTGTDGKANFQGLKAGTYTLVETKAPNGYNLAADKDVILAEVNERLTENTSLTVAATVEDSKGGLLPSTGGIGTTIFYVIGAVLVLGAGVLLVARKKASVK